MPPRCPLREHRGSRCCCAPGLPGPQERRAAPRGAGLLPLRRRSRSSAGAARRSLLSPLRRQCPA
eukprot:16290196-Heterocapsa_arctica.AAC.1